MRVLPIEEKERLKLPRQYLANVLYTVLGQDFKNWVDEQVLKRNKKVTKELKTDVEMDPEIEAIFRASKHISSK